MEQAGQIVADDRLARQLAYALAAVFALCCVLINPTGYVGAGADDEHYLAAARCWVAQGLPCWPPNHWWTRWPAIAPVALSSALLGESRLTISIGPFIYWASSLVAVAWLGTLWFNWRAGSVAAAILAAIPAFTVTALDPTCDGPELAFQLGALLAATIAYRRQSALVAVAAGLAAGLALQARDTSVVFVAVSGLAWLLLEPHRRKILFWAVPGLLTAIFAELAFYGFATGDPLLRYRLALGHVGVPTHALPEGFDTSQSPLFNPNYIKAWKREGGINLFWPIDPWLNLLTAAGFNSLSWTLVLGFVLFRNRLTHAQRRTTARILLAAGLWAILLVYGLAVDPRPRMFLPLAAASAIACGGILAAAWRRGNRLPAALLTVLHLALGLHSISQHASSDRAEARAQQWLAAYPNRIEITKGAQSYLTLVPGIRALPGDKSGKDMVILNTVTPCEQLARAPSGGPRHGRVVDFVREPHVGQSYLCLIAYTDAYYRDRGLVRR